MAYQIYMSISGQQQGFISENCSSKAYLGLKWQPDHPDEITVLSVIQSTPNADIDFPLGAHPFIITKYIDQSSPLLHNALREGELLSCEINFYWVSSQGTQEKSYSLKLEEAVIVSIELDSPDASLGDDATIVEYVGIRCRAGTATNHEKMTYGSSSPDRDA